MLTFCAGRLKIGFTFSFFALAGLAFALDKTAASQLLTVIICSLLHELGHIFAMCLFGISTDSIVFYAGGIRLSEGCLLCSKAKTVVILLAGIAANLIFAAVSMLLGSDGLFAAVNIALGVFNLLPFRYFDGGRIFCEITGGEPPLYLVIPSAALLAAPAVLAVLSGEIPVSLIVTLVIILSDNCS